MSTDKAKRPHDWTVSVRLEALIASGGMDEKARSAYCRAQGIYPEHQPNSCWARKKGIS